MVATEAPGLINRWSVPDARMVSDRRGTHKESSTTTSRRTKPPPVKAGSGFISIQAGTRPNPVVLVA